LVETPVPQLIEASIRIQRSIAPLCIHPVTEWEKRVGRHLGFLALLFSKHNEMGIDGETDDASGSAIPTDAVHGLDEVPKRQRLLPGIGSHTMKIRREALRAP